MNEWCLLLKKMYVDIATLVRIVGRESMAFGVRVGHQGPMLSPLLFIIVLK
jgi:hypothetical protein